MYIDHLHFLICELLAQVLFCELFLFYLYFSVFKKKEINILYSICNLVIHSLSTIVGEESIYSIQKKGKFKYIYFVMSFFVGGRGPGSKFNCLILLYLNLVLKWSSFHSLGLHNWKMPFDEFKFTMDLLHICLSH